MDKYFIATHRGIYVEGKYHHNEIVRIVGGPYTSKEAQMVLPNYQGIYEKPKRLFSPKIEVWIQTEADILQELVDMGASKICPDKEILYCLKRDLRNFFIKGG